MDAKSCLDWHETQKRVLFWPGP